MNSAPGSCACAARSKSNATSCSASSRSPPIKSSASPASGQRQPEPPAPRNPKPREIPRPQGILQEAPGKEKYQDLGPQNAWDTTRGQAGPYGLITNYTGGDAASNFVTPAPYLNASTPSVAGYAKVFAQTYDKPFPGSADLWNGRAILSTPFRDPNLLLSYSYWRVGQYTSFAGYEGVAQGLIHFAGEHCSLNFQGFMEGAAEEGQRAGLEVVNAAS